MAYVAGPLAEMSCISPAAYTPPALANCGRQLTRDEAVPNRPTNLSATALSGYRVKFDWSHINLSGDVYRIETDESGSWATVVDNLSSKTYTYEWGERKQANFRVRSRRSAGTIYSNPSDTTAGKTNTRVKGIFRDLATNTPQENVLILVRRKDTGQIIASGYTASNANPDQRVFDIELDNNWPYVVSVIAPDGKPDQGINGGVASEVEV